MRRHWIRKGYSVAANTDQKLEFLIPLTGRLVAVLTDIESSAGEAMIQMDTDGVMMAHGDAANGIPARLIDYRLENNTGLGAIDYRVAKNATVNVSVRGPSGGAEAGSVYLLLDAEK